MRSKDHRAPAWLAVLACLPVAVGWGAERDASEPKSVSQTRPEVKVALEKLKSRQPRLPLPPPTEEERKSASEWGLVNNGRMRNLYLPKSWLATNWFADPALTLDQVLKTECFWIVSRGNNCHYCLGHQEYSLKYRGLSDNRIASLDADWSIFLPQEQLAFDLAKKLTLTPEAVTDADIEALRPHFNDRQIVELTFAIARFNAMNRWTDSMGIPQDKVLRDTPVAFDAPTSERFQASPSLTAPQAERELSPVSRAEIVEGLAACKSRKPRVALPTDEEARQALPSDWPSGPIDAWVRALTYFPKAGVMEVQCQMAMNQEGKLPNLLKAQIAWVCAREDRAWYALGQAERRLKGLDQTADAIFALVDPSEEIPAGHREALAFARKLTRTPHRIADEDITRLREHFSDHETAEVVFVTCASAFSNRLGETLNLALEE